MLSLITDARLGARISTTQSKYWCAGPDTEGRKERRKRKGRKRKVEGIKAKKQDSLEKRQFGLGVTKARASRCQQRCLVTFNIPASYSGGRAIYSENY